ncbi:MAG: tetratricopeptide repeat protein [Candidatus Rokuibacteriota bacterium]
MRRLLLAAVTVLLAACQQAPTLPAPAPSAISPAVELRGAGDALMAKGDHASALEKYRQAVDLEPGSVPLRFALGTAYSFLDKRREAVAQFRWVVATAAAGSVERQEARRWLVRVGAWVEPAGDRAEVASSEAASKAASEDSSKKADPSAAGWISGKSQWPGLSPAQQPARVNVVLLGDEEATKDVKQRTGIALGDSYEFKDVPAGRYRVFGIFGEETILWDQKVAVQAGSQTDLMLAKAGSLLPAHVFPEAPRPRE